MRPRDCCSIGYASSHFPLPHYFKLGLLSSPLPLHLLWLGLLLPLSTRHSLTHSTPPGLAVLCSHQALEASTHYFGLGLLLPLSTCHLFIRSPSHNRFLPQYMAHWLYVWVIWVFIECES